MTCMTIEEVRSKSEFVRGELADLLAEATRGYVCACNYEYRLDETESVLVFYKPDESHVDSFSVDVTADSRWAIAKDVMRAVARRYE